MKIEIFPPKFEMEDEFALGVSAVTLIAAVIIAFIVGINTVTLEKSKAGIPALKAEISELRINLKKSDDALLKVMKK